MLDITIEGQSEPIGTTPNHPFWSEDRSRFVRADELRKGERLRTAWDEAAPSAPRDGPTAPRGPPRFPRVESVAERPGRHEVYNLQIDGEHVYHVGAAGVLVHNTYNGNSRLSRRANHGYEIFVKKTEQTLKYGISSSKFTAGGKSIRAQSQLSKLARDLGVNVEDLDTRVLKKFDRRSTALNWEKRMVDTFRADHNGARPRFQVRP